MTLGPTNNMWVCIRSAQFGFTYIGVLIFVFIAGIGLGAVGPMWGGVQKREREKQLIFVGHEFRRAIGMYYQGSGGGDKRFPMQLEDLLRDPRFRDTRRYLRRIYLDPMTNTTDWGLIELPGRGIIGVYSKSTEEPKKKSGFLLEDANLNEKKTYQEWKFTFGAFDASVIPSKNGGAQK